MKKINALILCLIVAFMVTLCGCEDMDHNYKQYMKEYSYSGKITKLRSYQGFERIILAWDNPKDQKSKTILITYGEDQEKKYDSLVDSVSIEGLDSGSGYEFTVYTVDNSGNLSVPVSISALPVTKTFVKNLTPPSCIPVKTGDGELAIKWNNLSTITMRYAGKITYKVTATDGFIKEGEIEQEVTPNQEIFDHTLAIEGLQPGIEYQVEYTTSVWPIVGKTVTVDKVEINGSTLLKFN